MKTYLFLRFNWLRTMFVIFLTMTCFINLQGQIQTHESGSTEREDFPRSIQVNVINVIAVYPNPAIDKTTFQLELYRTSNITILIYNSNRGLVAQPVVDRLLFTGINSVDMNWSNQAPGEYYYKILAKDKIQAEGRIQKY